jgi:hypothetical protein
VRGIHDIARVNLSIRIKVYAEGVAAVAVGGGIAAAIAGKYLEYLGFKDAGNLTLFSFGVAAFFIGVVLQIGLLWATHA